MSHAEKLGTTELLVTVGAGITLLVIRVKHVLFKTSFTDTRFYLFTH